MSTSRTAFSCARRCVVSALVLLAVPAPAGLLAAARPARTPAPSPSPVTPAPVEARLLKSLEARSIGPAVMGGRVADIALDANDASRFYVALGTGGLMKTTDSGVTFDGVFEDQPVASVGAVALAPSKADVVYVGTGEANDRNSSSWGDGVYRSTDGGKSWAHAGLRGSRTIARIVVHPRDAQTLYVAAMGDLWQRGGERGLFKSNDGGQTWKAVLTASGPQADWVGCGDVVLDPSNPETLYAALYARQRTPWSFVAGPDLTGGQDLGGIFKSSDGGVTWRKLTQGLPGATGRIGLDISRKNSQRVYAVVQSAEGGPQSIDRMRSRVGGVFRSDDGGASWARASALNPRPFYFSQIRVDPQDDQRVYVLGFALHVSEDGGCTFREDRFGKVHPDCHALVIDPRDPRRLLLGTDGGVYQSYDRGEDWLHLANFAAGEFYRINVDLGSPYRICGGLQDNLNWVGPSRTRSQEGITNADWQNIGGGDGFYCVFHPDDAQIVFAESQGGALHRFDLRTGQYKDLRPEPAEGQAGFRFHWNAPLIGSQHTKGALYLAGNRVFKLERDGEHWRAISPDLSAQDPLRTAATGSGAETYGVVYTLAESRLTPGLLWAGTDDGKLWRSDDDGAHWLDLTAQLPAAARGQWLSRIEASPHDPKSAFLALDAHRSGDFAPHLWRTTDAGRTWQDIASDLPKDGPVKVARQDPVNPALLYAGTEFGLFVSLDAGAHWLPLGELPTVAVDDLLVHPREGDLVIATHGRSLYVLDDTRALRELVAAREHALQLFAPRPAEAFHPLPGWADFAGNGQFRGKNPPTGALLTYWVKSAGAPVKIEIENAAGQPVAKLTGPGGAGVQRQNWDLKITKDLLTAYGGEGADLFVRPGEYTVTIKQGAATSTQKLTVSVPAGLETR
jgi:photosystem II stability/assembly factor-like uncharacterized protein